VMRKLFAIATVALAVLVVKAGTAWAAVSSGGCCPPGCPLCK
jgi:hypothetical protein